MNKEERKIFKEIENILFSYKKYKELNKNNIYSNLIMKIEVALEMIKECRNYEFIEMRYFKKMQYEDIAVEMSMDTRSVYNVRINLLEKLRFHFRIQGLI